MAERSSPKGNNGDFGKKLQRQLSRSKEKVRQRLGKTMESRDDHFEQCFRQFNDQQQEKVAKRGRKLVDYDSSRHHLEALQTAKKRDDVKIHKAEEEMNTAKSVYDGINTELKQELPSLFESRIGCFVTVFSAVSNLRDIFYKEMSMLNLDLKNVMNELHAQHPDKTFALNRIQRHGSLKRRSLTSPKAWKASFSEFHKGYSPRPGQRFSFRSPDKPRHSTLSRESSMREVSISQSGDLDAGSSHGEVYSSHAQGDAAAGNGLGSGGDGNDAEEATGLKEEASGPKPHAGSGNHGESGKTPPSESSCELNNSVGSESSELQLSAADNGPLHIDEGEDGSPGGGTPEPRAVENSEASGLHSDTQGPGLPHKDAAAEKQASPDSKSTEV